MKIVIVEGKRPTLMPEGPKIERRIIGPSARIKCYGLPGAEGCAKDLREADAVIVRPGTSFSKGMIATLKRAKVIVSLGVGYEHIDIWAAKKMGIPVCNVPDYGTEEVADTTVAMILSHERKIGLFAHYAVRRDPADWDWRIHRPVRRAREARIGIVGLGRIGTAVALRAKAFGYAVAFYDPYLARGYEKAVGLERVRDLDRLLRSSDIVSIHAPLNDETAGMIDRRFFGRMKPAGVLINTARGGIFKDADTLYQALKERPAFRIGTDVWPEEPPSDHPLVRAWRAREAWLGDRLILSPHAAFYSETSAREIRAFAAEIIREIARGGKPYNVVNGDRI